MTVGARIQLRRDTAANWTSANPILALGEPGYEKDTGKEKRGDGATAWNSLPYFGYGTFAIKSGLPFNLADYGAVGNGSTDDTAAIQGAINACSTAGGGTVIGKRGLVYKVSSAGTKAFGNSGGGSGNYALDIPSSVVLDLAGATLKLSGSPCVLLSNRNSNATSDTDLGLRNAIIDGNNIQLTANSLLVFYGVTRPSVRDVRIVNCTRIGLGTYSCTAGNYDNLEAENCAAIPIAIGQPAFQEVEARIGTVHTKNIAPDAVQAVNFQGNGFYFCGLRSTIAKVTQKACAGGVKIDRPSADVQIGEIWTYGDGIAPNSGLKIQGDNGPTYCDRITVGQVHSENNGGTGLFVDYARDVQIGRYFGSGNAVLGTTPDVWINAVRGQFGLIRSAKSGFNGVQVRAGSTEIDIDQCHVTDGGQTTPANSCGLVYSATDSLRIGQLTCIDTQGSHTMANGLAYNTAALDAHIGKFTSFGCNPMSINAAGSLWVGAPRYHATDPLIGELSPSASATTTTVSNGNVFGTFGGYGNAVIEIVPLNASARALAGVYYTTTSGSLVVHHAAAAGTEKFRYRIVGHALETTNIS